MKTSILKFCFISVTVLLACSDDESMARYQFVDANLVTYLDASQKETGYFMLQFMNDSASGLLDEAQYVGFNILVKGPDAHPLKSGNYVWNAMSNGTFSNNYGIASIKRHLRRLDECCGHGEFSRVGQISHAKISVVNEGEHNDVLDPVYNIQFQVRTASGDYSGSYRGKLRMISYIDTKPDF